MPDSDAGKHHRLRMTGFDPGRALRSGWRGAFGLKSSNIDPAATSSKAPGLINHDFAPESNAGKAPGLRNPRFAPAPGPMALRATLLRPKIAYTLA